MNLTEEQLENVAYILKLFAALVTVLTCYYIILLYDFIDANDIAKVFVYMAFALAFCIATYSTQFRVWALELKIENMESLNIEKKPRRF